MYRGNRSSEFRNERGRGSSLAAYKPGADGLPFYQRGSLDEDEKGEVPMGSAALIGDIS